MMFWLMFPLAFWSDDGCDSHHESGKKLYILYLSSSLMSYILARKRNAELTLSGLKWAKLTLPRNVTLSGLIWAPEYFFEAVFLD